MGNLVLELNGNRFENRDHYYCPDTSLVEFQLRFEHFAVTVNLSLKYLTNRNVLWKIPFRLFV